MVIKAITELKETHEEMGEILDELAILEDGVDADYSSVTIDYRWLLQDLRHRLISLKNRQKE